jgi:hypothetical protein
VPSSGSFVGVDLTAVAAAGVGLVVDGAEAGCGEGGEYARVRGDAGGDGLAAAEAGGDELVYWRSALVPEMRYSGVGFVHMKS